MNILGEQLYIENYIIFKSEKSMPCFFKNQNGQNHDPRCTHMRFVSVFAHI